MPVDELVAPPRIAIAPPAPQRRRLAFAPWLIAAAFLCLWALSRIDPSPIAVGRAFIAEIRSGRLLNDIVASLFRVSAGFTLAALMAIPLGLWMGGRLAARTALLPFVNFFRSLSPIAWIPFAILWFGIGDPPAIFLIWMASFFPLALAVCATSASVPSVYLRVAKEYGLVPWRVRFAAIAPQLITALRVTAGVAWMVVVAAEMIAVRSGLGFLIIDARNGLRLDLVVCGMIVIGAIGLLLDRVLSRLTRLASVRWGYDR